MKTIGLASSNIWLQVTKYETEYKVKPQLAQRNPGSWVLNNSLSVCIKEGNKFRLHFIIQFIYAF